MVQYLVPGLAHGDSHIFPPKKDLLLGKQEYTWIPAGPGKRAGSMQAPIDPEQQVPFLNIRMRQRSLPLVINSALCLSHSYRYGILQVRSQRARKTKDFPKALWSLSSCLGYAEHTMQVCRRTTFFSFVWKQDATEGKKQ